VNVANDRLTFKGVAGAEKTEYEANIEFFKEIDAEKARRLPGDRSIQYVIPKKEAGAFWPRLLKDAKKVPWLKVDFEKWKDEDESDDERGAGGMGGFGGAGGMGGFGGGDFESMMSNMGGYGGGKPDLDDFGDDDEADLPDLEDAPAGGEEENGEHEKKHDSPTKEVPAAAEPAAAAATKE